MLFTNQKWQIFALTAIMGCAAIAAAPHPALQALSKTERVPETGANPISLRAWRVTASTNVEAQVVESFGGRKFPVRLAYSAPAAGGAKQGGWVNFCEYNMCRPLQEWIPPYVGIKARLVEMDVLPVSKTGKARVTLRARQARCLVEGENFVETNDITSILCATGAWRTVSIDPKLVPRNRLTDVSLLFAGAGGVELYVANPRVACADGTFYELLNERRPSYVEGMPEGADRAVKFRPLPARPRIQLGMGTWGVLRNRADMADLSAWAKKWFPEYDLVFSGGGSLEPAIKEFVESLPDNVFFQYQKSQHGLRYPALYDALPRNEFGQRQDFMFNSIMATHPMIRDALDEHLVYGASRGVNNFQTYDYVWPYKFALWGYGADSVAAFRRDLAGTDEGLDLASRLLPDGRREPVRKIHFADYFRAYHGHAPSPQDCGITDWAQYAPPTSAEQKARGELGNRQMEMFFLLRNYEWLLQAQRWNARAASYGGTYDYLLNGETPANANDHLFLLKLKDTGCVSPEFFSATPKSLDRISRTSGLWIREARRVDKRFGITMETSRGGGGSQPYWSPRTAYAIAYFLAGLGFDAFEYDHVGCCSIWSETRKWRKPGTMTRTFADMTERHLVGSIRGYRRAQVDKARKAGRGDVFVLSRRSIGRERDMCGWVKALSDVGADCEMTDIVELPDILPQARVIIAGSEIDRPGVRQQLDAWLKGDANRKLVAAPAPKYAGRVRQLAEELGLEFVQSRAEESNAFVSRYRLACGESAVVFDRKAVESADRNKWYTDVWYPIYYKSTFDPAKYLYFDKVPDRRSQASLPVAENGKYRIYRYHDDREETAVAEGHVLRLVNDGNLCEVFYFAPDTEAFRSFIAEVRKDRALTGFAFGKDGGQE